MATRCNRSAKSRCFCQVLCDNVRYSLDAYLHLSCRTITKANEEVNITQTQRIKGDEGEEEFAFKSPNAWLTNPKSTREKRQYCRVGECVWLNHPKKEITPSKHVTANDIPSQLKLADICVCAQLAAKHSAAPTSV